MRLRVMFLAMCKFFGWQVEDVVKPFADEIPLYPDGSGNEGVPEAAAAEPDATENHDLPGDVPADGGSAEDAPDYEGAEGEEPPSAADMGYEDDAGVGEGHEAAGGGDADVGEN